MVWRLELRQQVEADPTWLRGEVATVWSAGTLWWLDPKASRSTPAAAGKGAPLGRLGPEVVRGELRDDDSSYVATGRTLPFAGMDWRSVAEGALV